VSLCVKPHLTAAALFAATPAFAGALLLPEGDGQLIATTTFADARKAYDRQGRLITTPSYRKFEAQSYLEYGAADWLTIVAEGGATDFRGSSAQPGLPAQGPAPQYRGLGLGAVGGRTRLFETCGFYFSLEAGLRTASPVAQVFLDMKTGVQADARLQLFHALELLDLPGFLDAQLGYRSRGQNGDEMRADLTLGLRPRADFMLLAQSFTALAPWRGSTSPFVTQKFQLSGVYDLNRTFSMQLGVAAAPVGFDSPAERAIVTGVWARF
jgi:protein XagA